MVVRGGSYRGVVRGKTIELEAAPDLAEGQAVLVELSPVVSTNELEKQYQRIGWWKGPHGTREVQQQVREFWMRTGHGGAEWLVHRLRTETHPEILEAAAALLANMGEAAVPAILGALSCQSETDPAQALLKALRWMSPAAVGPFLNQVTDAIRRYLASDHPEVRATAASTTTVLAAGQALPLLRAALQTETDPDVHEAIEDELSNRQAQ